MTISIKTAADGLSGSLDWNGTPVVTVDGDGVTVPVATTSTQPVQLSQCPITKEYTSAEQTITASSAVTLTHGLGSVPKNIVAFIVCKTAELGYAIGDIVKATDYDYSGTYSYGVVLISDATTITARVGTGIPLFNKTTGAGVSITPANWKLYVRAWA